MAEMFMVDYVVPDIPERNASFDIMNNFGGVLENFNVLITTASMLNSLSYLNFSLLQTGQGREKTVENERSKNMYIFFWLAKEASLILGDLNIPQ